MTDRTDRWKLVPFMDVNREYTAPSQTVEYAAPERALERRCPLCMLSAEITRLMDKHSAPETWSGPPRDLRADLGAAVDRAWNQLGSDDLDEPCKECGLGAGEPRRNALRRAELLLGIRRAPVKLLPGGPKRLGP